MRPPQAPSSGGAVKWVLIVCGVLVTSCCACLGLAAAFGDSPATSSVTDPSEAAPTLTGQPEAPQGDEPNALEPLQAVEEPTPKPKPGRPGTPARPMTTDEADAVREADPSGTQIYDSLKPARAVIDLPTRDEFIEELRSTGLKDDSPKFKRRLKQYERLLELKQRLQDGSAKPRDEAEADRLMEQLGDL